MAQPLARSRCGSRDARVRRINGRGRRASWVNETSARRVTDSSSARVIVGERALSAPGSGCATALACGLRPPAGRERVRRRRPLIAAATQALAERDRAAYYRSRQTKEARMSESTVERSNADSLARTAAALGVAAVLVFFIGGIAISDVFWLIGAIVGLAASRTRLDGAQSAIGGRRRPPARDDRARAGRDHRRLVPRLPDRRRDLLA